MSKTPTLALSEYLFALLLEISMLSFRLQTCKFARPKHVLCEIVLFCLLVLLRLLDACCFFGLNLRRSNAKGSAKAKVVGPKKPLLSTSLSEK